MSDKVYHNEMYYGANPILFDFARQLRMRETEAESIMVLFKREKLNGLRFRRQHPIVYFIADFFCPKAKLVVEVDGNIHDLPTQYIYDRNRDNELAAHGLKVLRFTNDEVLTDIETVINGIVHATQVPSKGI